MNSNLLYHRISLLAFLLFFGLGGLAYAQLLLEVQTVAAISLQLDASVRLPKGSCRAVGSGGSKLIAKVPDASRYTDWEVYTATGIAARLQPAFVQQVMTSFALAGYFLEQQSEEQLAGETHSRYLFSDAGAKKTLLYVIRTPQELVWLVARAH